MGGSFEPLTASMRTLGDRLTRLSLTVIVLGSDSIGLEMSASVTIDTLRSKTNGMS